MPKVSKGFLKLQAAMIWFTGGIVLTLKGSSLLIEAASIHPDRLGPGIAFAAGLLFGGIKARYLFSRIGIKNLNRIDMLSVPRFWQFYRIRFFMLLICMIVLGISLSKLAQGQYPILIAVGIMDLAIATALLGSSYIFGMRKNLLN